MELKFTDELEKNTMDASELKKDKFSNTTLGLKISEEKFNDIVDPILEKEPYRVNTIPSDSMILQREKEREKNQITGMVVKIVVAFLVCGILIFGGKKIVSILLPEGEDITNLLKKDANAIASELGVTLVSNTEWVTQIPQYSSGTLSVKSDSDAEIGIVYIDGKQAGIHIRSNKYTIYGIQINDGEKEAYDNTGYPFDGSFSVINDMAEGKTTTYFYYNTQQNDCVALTINDTTNRVVAITYFYDYARIVETLDMF